jgi:hypothetical protein
VVSATPASGWARGIVRRIWTGTATLWGGLSLVGVLAVSLTYPILAVLFLGYLVLAQGRLVRLGTWAPLPGSRIAGRIGCVAVVGLILFVPVWIVQQSAADAQIIAPGSVGSHRWMNWSKGLMALWMFQLAVVVLRGGRAWYWFRPIANVWWLVSGLLRPAWYRERWRDAGGLLASLHLREVLSLGTRAYLGSIAWLALPSALLLVGPAYPVLGVMGGLWMGWCALHLPIMQIRLGVEDRLAVFQEVGVTRDLRRRAPVAMLLAMVVWVITTIPLYLVLIEPFAKGLWWLPGIAFVVLLGLGRWIWGLAVRRAMIRQQEGKKARLPVRVICWVVSYLLGLVYAEVVFLSPYLLFRGHWGLFEHHGLLFPVVGY